MANDAILQAAAAALSFGGKRGPQSVDGLRLRRVLQKRSGVRWSVPEPYGPDGWWL
jgi:hypothetical protein